MESSMKFFRTVHACHGLFVGTLTVAGLALGLTANRASAAEPEKPAAAAETTDVKTAAVITAEERQKRDEWRKALSAVPLPKKGCYRGVYPSMAWQEIKCVPTPHYPQPPRNGGRPQVIGNANDVSAEVPTSGQFISQVTGSFSTVSNVTSESGPIANSGPAVANAYTLQINTNFMSSKTSCSGSPNANCQGWEQFVFENDGSSASAYIQYWLIKYNKTCPPNQGWNQFSFSGSTDIYCWKDDASGAVPISPAEPISNLANISLTGKVSAGGDSVSLYDAKSGMTFPVTGDNAVNAGAGWQFAEFNIFGDGGNSSGGGRASFNSGASIVPRTEITYGGTAAPLCSAQGFTGETNNLSFGPNAPAASQPGPAILFTESSAGGAPTNCGAATSVGDTHLLTFNGLKYDFQGSGDFLLAQSGPDFIVQTRQALAVTDPSWIKNATINKAVAAQMGKTHVTLTIWPAKLTVDGKDTTVANGKTLLLASGVQVSLTDNLYTIVDPAGDSVRAWVNNNGKNTWLDIAVGLGKSAGTQTRGLLGGDASADAGTLKTAAGHLLTAVTFTDLYHTYADGWRVAANETLLPADAAVKPGIPEKPLYASDLDAESAARARATCTAAGVTDPTLLDDCILDTVVLGGPAGDATAAKIYVRAIAPRAVMPRLVLQ